MYEIAMNDRAIANIDRVQEYVDEIADEIFEAGKDIETAKLFHDDIYCADLSSIEEITYEQIIGILVFKIPRIGNIILLLEDKIYVILLLNLALIIYINTRRVEEKKKMRREKKKIEDKRK